MPYFIIRWTTPAPTVSNPGLLHYSSRIVTAADQAAANDLAARYVAEIRDGYGHTLTAVEPHSAGR